MTNYPEQVQTKVNNITLGTLLKDQEGSVANLSALLQDLEVQLRRIIPIDVDPEYPKDLPSNTRPVEDYCIFTRISNVQSSQYGLELGLKRLISYLKETV